MEGKGLSDVFSGRRGRDTLNGRAGNDRLFGGEGADTLNGGVDNDELWADASVDGIGAEGTTPARDELNGGPGNDKLYLGYGNDVGNGGADDDAYYLRADSELSESFNAGIDTVYSLVNWRLGDDFENLTLTQVAKPGVDANGQQEPIGDPFGGVGTIGFVTVEYLGARVGIGNELNNVLIANGLGNRLTGLGGADKLIGGVGNDELLGGDGLDELLGGGGADTLDGGADHDILNGDLGNDTYILGLGSDDEIIESVGGAAGGIDTVRSAVTYSLGANLENLTLTGTANIDGSGNPLANRLIGNSGNNTLDAQFNLPNKPQADYLDGGAGDDILLAGGAADILIGGEGVDDLQGGGGDDVYFRRSARGYGHRHRRKKGSRLCQRKLCAHGRWAQRRTGLRWRDGRQ